MNRRLRDAGRCCSRSNSCALDRRDGLDRCLQCVAVDRSLLPTVLSLGHVVFFEATRPEPADCVLVESELLRRSCNSAMDECPVVSNSRLEVGNDADPIVAADVAASSHVRLCFRRSVHQVTICAVKLQIWLGR